MKKIFLCALLFLKALDMHAQYDSALARKLEADERGMHRFILVILKTGPFNQADKKTADSLFAGHMKNIGSMAKAGKLILAGPFLKNDAALRGLYFFNVKTIEEAKALVANDPAVAAGLLQAEYFNWYGSAALMAIPELHEKIQRPSF